MISLAVAGIVRWVNRDSNSIILKQNWSLRPSTAIETARAIFYGVCIAFLGVTGTLALRDNLALDIISKRPFRF